MDFTEITSSQAQKFIKDNLHITVEDLLLSGKKYSGLNIPLLATQVEGKNKAEKKLPTWFQTEGIIYPVKLSMEQCSSEITAAYKASLVAGDIFVDLTGGFGVDSVAFAEKIKKVIYIERNSELADIVKYNFGILKKDNIEVLNTSAEDFINKNSLRADWIYIDPARRKGGSKVFRFADCEPNVIQLQQELFKISNHIMIKTSPLLDIDLAIKELGCVAEVHVVAVDNECKELLFLLNKPAQNQETKIVATNIRKGNKEEFSFTRKMENESVANFGLPLEYIYEPNAAILKAGAFKSLANLVGLNKLHRNSHLYTSETVRENFPGRIFRLLKIVKYSKQEILVEIPEGKANITTRNFPDSVEMIRKKTGLKDGGDKYLFGTTDLNGKYVVLLTEKVN
jgi:hypothetical protein